MPCTIRNPLNASARQLLAEWARAVAHTPSIFKRLAFRKRTLEEELQEALLRGSLRKAFGGFDLWMLGLGLVVASGWASLTGQAGQLYAGPSVIVSYVFAGLAAFLAACCFAELCAEFPVSGGAFSYVMVTFGEFPAFVALASLLLEYALGMAAQARNFTVFLTSLLNLKPMALLPQLGGAVAPGEDPAHTFDPLAAGVVLLMSLLLSFGVRESAWFISSVTSVKMAFLVLISAVGYAVRREGATSPSGQEPPGPLPATTSPWFNQLYDADGMFLGAAVVFFSTVGFDAVANAAEEVRDVRHLPWAILGTVGASTLLYVMLSAALVLVVSTTIACPAWTYFVDGLPTVDGVAVVSFVDAFTAAWPGPDLKWMQYIVSLAALFGITTALTVGLFSASRIVMAASRDWLLPPVLARISPRTQTPLIAQMVLGVIIAALAMFVEVDTATALVSFGTLVVLWLVCNAQMARRYWPDVQMRFTQYGTVETTASAACGKLADTSWAPGRRLSAAARKRLIWAHLLLINAVSIALAIYYSETTSHPAPPSLPPTTTIEDWARAQAAAALPACERSSRDLHHQAPVLYILLAWALLTASFQLCCPLEYRPSGWHVPWWAMPWLPSCGVLLVVFSVGALPQSELWKVGTYFLVLLAVYLLYSLPMSYIKHNQVDYVNTGELKVVELVFTDGRWQPKRPAFLMTPMMSAQTGLGLPTPAPSAALAALGPAGSTSQSSSQSGGSLTAKQMQRLPPHLQVQLQAAQQAAQQRSAARAAGGQGQTPSSPVRGRPSPNAAARAAPTSPLRPLPGRGADQGRQALPPTSEDS